MNLTIAILGTVVLRISTDEPEQDRDPPPYDASSTTALITERHIGFGNEQDKKR